MTQVSQQLVRYRVWLIALFQAWLVVCSLLLAWLLRFDFSLPYRRTLLIATLVLVSVRLTTMAVFGLLRGWWRYAGVRDGVDILKAVGAGSLLFWLVMRLIDVPSGFPRTIYVLEGVLTAGFLGGVRLLSRVVAESARENGPTVDVGG